MNEARPWNSFIEVDGERRTEEAFLRDALREKPSDESLHDFAERMHERFKKLGVERTFQSVYNKAKRLRRESSAGDTPRLIKFLQERPRTLDEVADFLQLSPSAVRRKLEQLRTQGYGIELGEARVNIPQLPPRAPAPDAILRPTGEEITFGVVSDTHFGSLYEQPSSLANFVTLAREDFGVEVLLFVGDLLDGCKVYRGQQHEQYATTLEDQLEAACERLPEGVNWFGIGGNHDYSFYKHYGMDALRMFSAMRKDFVTLGYDAADVELTENTVARLWHPTGGMGYAISYRAQRYSVQLAFEAWTRYIASSDEPTGYRFLFVGHFHQRGRFQQGPIEVYLTQCFQSATPFFRSRGFVPYIGGWIIQARLGSAAVERATATWVGFREREDDYRNYTTSFKPPLQKITVNLVEHDARV